MSANTEGKGGQTMGSFIKRILNLIRRKSKPVVVSDWGIINGEFVIFTEDEKAWRAENGIN